ncbi:hypothetical protein D3C86_2215550 [compost metagenome]
MMIAKPNLSRLNAGDITNQLLNRRRETNTNIYGTCHNDQHRERKDKRINEGQLSGILGELIIGKTFNNRPI